MPFAAVNGIDVYFEVHGSGPPLLNISGSGNDLRRSLASILPVNRAFETLSDDRRGLGQTSKPESGCTLDPDEAFAMRCRLTDRRFDPDADGPIPDIAPVASSELIAERMPNATMRIFDGGHTFLIQDRTAFPAVIEFLEFDGGAS